MLPPIDDQTKTYEPTVNCGHPKSSYDCSNMFKACWENKQIYIYIYIYIIQLYTLTTTSLIGQQRNPGCCAYFYIMKHLIFIYWDPLVSNLQLCGESGWSIHYQSPEKIVGYPPINHLYPFMSMSHWSLNLVQGFSQPCLITEGKLRVLLKLFPIKIPVVSPYIPINRWCSICRWLISQKWWYIDIYV